MMFRRRFITLFLLCVLCLHTPLFVYAQEGEVAPAGVDQESPINEAPTEVADSATEEQTTETEEGEVGVSDTTGEGELVDETGGVSSGDTADAETPTVISEVIPESVVSPETVVDPAVLETAELLEEKEAEQEVLVAEVLASSTLVTAESLPFTLTSTTTFAINEVPEFIFLYNNAPNIFEKVLDSVGETAAALYEDSFLETVVDAVTDTFETVIDFILPTAEGQELEEIIESPVEEVTPVEEVVEPEVVVSPESPAEEVKDTETTEVVEQPVLPTETTDSETVPENDVLDDIQPELTASTSEVAALEILPPLPYAKVDGIVRPIMLTPYNEGQGFSVRFEGQSFDIGQHAMELHLLYDDEEVVFYSTFTVSGVVLQKIPLYDTYFAVLTIDTAGARTLWLAQYASTTLLSFEKITDDTTLPEVPVFTFVDGALLWVLPGGEGMMGLDVVSKTQFGQTINPLPKDENILNLTSGSFDVTVVGETLEVERNIPSKTP